MSAPYRAGSPEGGSPGHIPEGAVEAALAALAPIADRVVVGGPIGPMTTYRVGGAAAVLVTATGHDDLLAVGTAVAVSGLPLLVVGRGSNLLVADAGFAGIAVLLDPAGFGDIEVDGLLVRAGAAVPMPALARQTVEAGLTGFEWAVGVPGSIGGGVRMNAGGHGSDIAHCLHSCEVADLGAPGPAANRTLWPADLDYRYRSSTITPFQVVTAAEFELRAGDIETGRATIREIVRWRREHQPGGQNAGSVFTNPPGEPPADSAGWLIDAAGCKGRRWRSAMVSTKHANFIQADEGGSADDVRALIEVVRAEVAARHGLELATEVRMVGFAESSPPGSAS
jgi:UDP-N-acetylmuramate dehydrogenase